LSAFLLQIILDYFFFFAQFFQLFFYRKYSFEVFLYFLLLVKNTFKRTLYYA